jgi:hypothetical protein
LAQRMLMMDSKLTMEQQTDPELKLMYGAQQKHALLDTVWELMGVKDATPYLVPPDSPQYQQAQQQAQQAQQQQQMQAMQQAQQAEQFQRGLLQSNDRREWKKVEFDMTDKVSDNLLNEEKFDWQKWVDSSELRLEKEQKRGVSVG